MPEDTHSGNAHRFPTTRASIVLGAKSDDNEERTRSMELISLVYWKPVYGYVRLRWRFSPEETKDITQDFFLKVVERNLFAAYDPAKGRFRSFVRVCLDRFIIDRGRSAGAAKRKGNAPRLAVDFDRAEEELGEANASLDELDAFFDSEWMRHLLDLAVGKLAKECSIKGKTEHYRIFERFYLAAAPAEPPSYAELAEEFALTVVEITNRLGFMRRHFRRIVLETLRAITGSEEEFQQEARWLLGEVGQA